MIHMRRSRPLVLRIALAILTVLLVLGCSSAPSSPQAEGLAPSALDLGDLVDWFRSAMSRIRVFVASLAAFRLDSLWSDQQQEVTVVAIGGNPLQCKASPTGPGDTVARLSEGTTIRLVGQRVKLDDCWWQKVQMPDGQRCWVRDIGLGPQAEANGVGIGVTGAAGEAAFREAILRRARAWIDAAVAYGTLDDDPDNNYCDGYRTDCAGFISYAWQLSNRGMRMSPSTVTLDQYVTEVPLSDLQPGDAVNNIRALTRGHVVLFVKWSNPMHTKFIAYEENCAERKAVETELTLVEMATGGYTIEEYAEQAPGPYHGQRLRAIP